MPWYEILLLTVSFLALLFIVAKLLAKFPLAARVDIDALPEKKQEAKKQEMIDARLRRKLKDRWKKLSEKLGPLFEILRDKWNKFYQYLAEKEKNILIKHWQKQKTSYSSKSALSDKVAELLRQAEASIKQEDLVVAEKKLIEAIALDPKNKQAFLLLGDIYIEQKKYAEARESFLYLLKISGKKAEFYNKLGEVEQAEGNLAEAESYFLQSIDLDKDNVNYLYNLAMVYQLEGDVDKADKYLDKVLSLEPNNPRYLDALLKISIIRKDKNKALRVWERLRKINPENKKLPELKEQIDNL